MVGPRAMLLEEKTWQLQTEMDCHFNTHIYLFEQRLNENVYAAFSYLTWFQSTINVSYRQARVQINAWLCNSFVV